MHNPKNKNSKKDKNADRAGFAAQRGEKEVSTNEP